MLLHSSNSNIFNFFFEIKKFITKYTFKTNWKNVLHSTLHHLKKSFAKIFFSFIRRNILISNYFFLNFWFILANNHYFIFVWLGTFSIFSQFSIKILNLKFSATFLNVFYCMKFETKICKSRFAKTIILDPRKNNQWFVLLVNRDYALIHKISVFC